MSGSMSTLRALCPKSLLVEAKYIWLAVNDATRCTYIKPAAHRAEAGTIFRAYKATVETESGGRR